MTVLQIQLAAQSANGMHRAALLTALEVTSRAMTAQPREFITDVANGGVHSASLPLPLPLPPPKHTCTHTL